MSTAAEMRTRVLLTLLALATLLFTVAAPYEQGG
jgi:hypothetical protein